MNELIKQLIDALQKQLAQLKTARNEMRLFSGERIGTFAGFTYYRFEIPEGILFSTTERVSFIFGEIQPISVTGNIIALENQYLTVALPLDFGASLPEVQCAWSYEDELKPIIDLLRNLNPQAPILQSLFNPADNINNHIVNYNIFRVSETLLEQVDIVRKISQNRVTMLWGPVLTGKTQALALCAVNFMKAGRKVLFVAPSNDIIDSMLFTTIDYGEQLGIDTRQLAARVDLPSPDTFETISKYSFEQQVEILKEERRKVFAERTMLLDAYWKVKIKQILHEDYYNKIQEKRERLAELRQQIDTTSNNISQLNQTIIELQNESLIERVKKGFSKDDIKDAYNQLAYQQQINKHLLATQQVVSNEITETELYAPVAPKELMEFKETNKRIDELGGLEKVTKAVENFISVDELALLQSKLFIATGINAALIDPAIRNQRYDLVIVNEAQRVNLPTLAALSALAREKFVIAGDPFEVEPEFISLDDNVNQQLQKDIFLHVAQTTELHQLFDWSENNKRWSIMMKSQFATTPKLSSFMAAVLFDDKINVFPLPDSKGTIYFIDTTDIRSICKQFAGKKKILPYNELHTRQILECVKHALIESNRHASDVGIIFPFVGPTLYTKLQLRLQGIRNLEVGTPQSFCNRRKKAIIFDTTMAGVEYTMLSIDDRIISEHKIARIFNTVFSCVKEDLYIIADMSHFKLLYPDRLFTRLLMLLQAEADVRQPVLTPGIKKFDDLDRKEREELFSLYYDKSKTETPIKTQEKPEEKIDPELEIQMKRMAKQWEVNLTRYTGHDIEREVYFAVQRVLGWRTDVNLISQFVGGDLLFRNSFSTEDIIRKLPLDTCRNEKDFRLVMEKWNLLIYDMSGGHKADMSFFASKGPEGRIRQYIRNLHAFYSSEVEAAIEEGKKRIAVEVARVFQELLGKSRPDSPAEWSTAYLNFLSRLEAYLSWISEQVRK